MPVKIHIQCHTHDDDYDKLFIIMMNDIMMIHYLINKSV